MLGGVVGAGHRRDAPHVVDVAVGGQQGDQAQPVLLEVAEDGLAAFCGEHPCGL